MSVDSAIGGPPDPRSLPAPVQLILLTNGRRVSEVLYVLAELRIADHLADGPLGVEQLAEKTGSHADSLYRLLRCAASFGLLCEESGHRFAETDLTVGLRSDIPFSVRDLVLYNGSDAVRRPYGQMLHTVRTGAPSFEHVYGRPFFDYLGENPDAGGLFDRAMTQMSRSTTHLFLGQYDFTGFARIADIGGGHGFFLGAVLESAPKARGILLDRPSVVSAAREHLAGTGVADRVEIVPGDFFEPLPTGCDLYLLKQVLHDWDAEHAVRILRNVRTALGDGGAGRLLVLDHVLAPPNQWDQGKFLDLDMMLRFGGRERTLPEWRELLDAAGFELTHEPAQGRWTVLECRPVR
ncbi:methyltransferase [Streptomyces sp. NPDC059063]|uniref:methyltransferase n=1 Tax=unclassified Streptomyces TaxID=2593676 RepID=UPI0036950D5C